MSRRSKAFYNTEVISLTVYNLLFNYSVALKSQLATFATQGETFITKQKFIHCGFPDVLLSCSLHIGNHDY